MKGENPTLRYRSSHQRCSLEKALSKISQKSPENTCARVSVLIFHFSLFSLSFSSFGNCQLNWKCEYMKRNSWKFLQISWRFFTFIWFNKYFEWLDRYTSSLHLLWEKRKKYFIFVWLIGKINHSLTGIGHQVYTLKKFNFSILYSGQCSLLAQSLPC